MDAEHIRALRLAYPFKPFRLDMEDGRSMTVSRPLQIAIAPDGRATLVVREEEGQPTEWFHPSWVKDAVVLEADQATPNVSGS